MMRIILLLAAIVVVASLVWYRRRRGRTATARKIARQPAKPAAERLIRFRPGPNACSPARQQAGKQVPAGDLPRLPLPGCRAHRCQCRYEETPERRKRQRRQQHDRRESVRYDPAGGGDRRKKDRRTENDDPWETDRE